MACRRAVSCPLDDAEQPQDEDKDENAAKTDIHEKLLLFGFAAETVGEASVFHSLRMRQEHAVGTILPIRNMPDLLDFPALTRK